MFFNTIIRSVALACALACGLLAAGARIQSAPVTARTAPVTSRTAPVPARTAPAEASGCGFAVGKGTFLLNGKPFVVKAAELHYPRIPRPYWEHRIKLCKALGMNTICLYVFWNIHEQREGVFDFTGQNDVAEFCRLCQKHGMYVIVRPGPYVCAEWEMGGLPWWLLKKKDIRLRSLDPYFMERVTLFEQKAGEQLAPLTIAHGGPIIMVQVENEYGAYATDKPYIMAIRDVVKKSFGVGDDAAGGAAAKGPVLFQCDWSSNFTENALDDLVWTMNFGTGANIDAQFRRLDELRPDAPKMCSEFWSGWFDKWGMAHETRPADAMVQGIDEMLSKNISFSLYMTHGGTSFGRWAGGNCPPFAPDVTSYDYDAPISEWGTVTPKYHLLRQTLAKYADRKLPAIPRANPIVHIPAFTLDEYVPLTAGITATHRSAEPLSMEHFDMGWGSVIYSATLPELAPGATLTVDEAHDYARVFVGGEYVGTLDRRLAQKTLTLPCAVKAGSRLTIMVEGMGRVNFGQAIVDYKGITGSVKVQTTAGGHLATYELRNWDISLVPDDYQTAAAAFGNAARAQASAHRFPAAGKAGYYRGYFTLGKPGDTFLSMERWGKGQVYINGHELGRFWYIGPQQTLYVPGCWLRKGKNEIIVCDLIGPRAATCEGLTRPVLDKLQSAQGSRHDNPADRPDLSHPAYAANGSFKAGNGWQQFLFDKPFTGRYLALECQSLINEADAAAAIAELYALGEGNARLSREAWTVRYADSEDDANGNHTADKVFDLQESTYWATVGNEKFPHLIVIDMGSVQTLCGIQYLPRAEQGAPGGVKDFAVMVF